MTNVTSLPIKLIVKPCAPIKDADYKVTLSTNKPAVSLLDLFPGMWISLELFVGIDFLSNIYILISIYEGIVPRIYVLWCIALCVIFNQIFKNLF